MERTTVLIGMRPARLEALTVALAGLGLAMPATGRFAAADGLLLARTAPHQMLAMRAGVDQALMAELAPLGDSAGLIDLSDGRAGLALTGPAVQARLAMLVPVDLHDDRFPPGACAATLMAHVSVLLLRHGAESYELQCGRSFAKHMERAVDAALV